MSNNHGYRHYPLSYQSTTRGPITETFNGQGFRPWLAELTLAPGWIYLVSRPMTNEDRRLCWRCALDVEKQYPGLAHLHYSENPPNPEDRCTRCERTFGERS